METVGTPVEVIMLAPESLGGELLSSALMAHGIKVVGMQSDPVAFLDDVERRQGGVAVALTALADALPVLEMVHKRSPQTGLLAVARGLEPSLLRRALASGVHGVVDACRENMAAVVNAVQTVATGARIFPAAGPESEAAPVKLRSKLSPRELEVLAYVSAGYDNLKISAHLGICERTVKAHMSALYRKLNVENRAQLVLWGLQLGLQPQRADAISLGR